VIKSLITKLGDFNDIYENQKLMLEDHDNQVQEHEILNSYSDKSISDDEVIPPT